MSHDLPDWLALNAPATVQQVTDLGELAVRLGSIDRFHRGGDVIDLESFEDGLSHWVDISGGGANSVELSRLYARSGRFSARMYATVGDPFFAGLEQYQPYPTLSSFGFEWSFLLLNDIDRLEAFFILFNGANAANYAVRYNDVANSLQYLGASGAWVTFATGVSLKDFPGPFHVAKLVVDGMTGTYSRFILNSTGYPLTGIAPYVEVNATAPTLLRYWLFYPPAGVTRSVYIDDAILTQNEYV